MSAEEQDSKKDLSNSNKKQKVDDTVKAKANGKSGDSDGEADYGNQEAEDSFDDDFDDDAEAGEDELDEKEGEEFDMEKYLKWREEHGDDEEKNSEPAGSDVNAAEEGEAEAEEDAYDDEEDKWIKKERKK